MKIITPSQLFNHIAKNGMNIPDDYYAVKSFKWDELLKKQTDKPSLAVLTNLLKVATVLEGYKFKYFGGAPIIITSGWRSLAYNQKIPGAATKSMHISGMALDFTVAGYTNDQVKIILDPIHKGGLELYINGWSHIDIRPQTVRFDSKGNTYPVGYYAKKHQK